MNNDFSVTRTKLLNQQRATSESLFVPQDTMSTEFGDDSFKMTNRLERPTIEEGEQINLKADRSTNQTEKKMIR